MTREMARGRIASACESRFVTAPVVRSVFELFSRDSGISSIGDPHRFRLELYPAISHLRTWCIDRGQLRY
jgi:hypothetical protein